MEENLYLIYFAGILALGITAQWLAWRLHLPSILLLLAFGFFASLLPQNPDEIIGRQVLFPIVSLSVAVILFEGGMSLRFNELREVGPALGGLVTIGALVVWGLASLAAHFLVGFSPAIATVVGAIVVVTGPTVVGPLLSHIRPARKIGSLAKWEGIVIDPIGAVLAVLVFEFIMKTGEGATWVTPLWSIAMTILVGVVLGGVTAYMMIFSLKSYWVPDFLHNAFILAVLLTVFAVSNTIQSESGLLTVTVLGLLMANQKQIPVRHIFEFKENLRVLLISCLFIVLAARVPFDNLVQVGWGGLLFVVFLIVIVRPASVFLSTIGSSLNWREKAFLCFMAPRGIVAAAVGSIFSFELSHHAEALGLTDIGGTSEGALVVPIVFLVIVGTVTFYGLTASPAARWLGLSSPSPQGVLIAGADRWIRELAVLIKNAGFHVVLVDTNFRNITAARMQGLSAQCASILSDFVSEELNLGGVGRLLAATPNDEVNSLACMEFTHLFGRKEVYQLSPWDSGSGKRQSVSDHLRGRVIFGHGLDFYKIARRVTAGAQFKKTTITEEFTYHDFQQTHGESATLLFVVVESRLRIVTADDSFVPKAGQTIIALIDSPPKAPAKVEATHDADETSSPEESPAKSVESE
ncbi:cation:proton antiporter [Blastopirellula marina]|uniref:Sodium:proton exchanger n=1 Tax=Blastopirellula marina TaxID=124 RepID=A0A2S8F817_9BACT|nr:sodium:proton antiporter [Blastopirellula marina]PQO28311.1 sodium:proton exchanger [Blastopirellula marina]PTL41851.1 sodium:proton exchanger [Blastopirellula marina]